MEMKFGIAFNEASGRTPDLERGVGTRATFPD